MLTRGILRAKKLDLRIVSYDSRQIRRCNQSLQQDASRLDYHPSSAQCRNQRCAIESLAGKIDGNLNEVQVGNNFDE